MLNDLKQWLYLLKDYRKYLKTGISKKDWNDQCQFCLQSNAVCLTDCKECIWPNADPGLAIKAREKHDTPCQTWGYEVVKDRFIATLRMDRDPLFVKARLKYLNKVQLPYIEQLIEQEKEKNESIA